VLAIGSFFALLALSRVPGPERWPAIGRLAAGLVAGSALAAVALLPFLELLMRAGDLENRSAHLDDDLPFAHVIAYALPDYWGRPTGVQTEGFSITRAFYAGALPFGLAGWAVINRPGRERIAVAATGLVAMAVVLGMPGVYEAVRAIPGFNHAYNSRLVIVGLLAIALLAGWGLDDLVDGVRRPNLLRWGAVALWATPIVVVFARVDVSLGAIGDGIAAAWAWAEPSQGTKATVLPLAALAIWVVVAGAGVVLIWLRAGGKLAGGAFAVAAIGLTVLDLSRAGMGQNPAIPVEHARQPVTPALQRLLDERPARFAGLAPQLGLQALPPNLSMRYGLYDARSYDFPVERRYNRLWRSTIAPREVGFTPHQILADTREESLRALGLLGVSHLLQPPGEPPVDGVTVAYEGPDARVLENPFALPRAWVVSGQRTVAGEDAQLAAITDPGFDARREAIVAAPVPGVAEGPGEEGGSARIVRYEPDRVELEVSAPRRALAVLSDLHYPGWHATVDGREAEIERVDYLLRGVAVDEGEHRVVLTYAPLSWRLGWIVSLLTALLLGVVVWKGARRWRAGSSAP
jgi:hypothetical protein